MSQDCAFCGCFGSPRGRQNVPSRPQSAPAKHSGHKAAPVEQDEGWKIGSQVPQTPQPQAATPTVSPAKPADSLHGAKSPRGDDASQVQVWCCSELHMNTSGLRSHRLNPVVWHLTLRPLPSFLASFQPFFAGPQHRDGACRGLL